MKKTFFALVTATFFLQACEGPMGPAGPAGPSIAAEIHEVKATFNSANNFSADFDFEGTPLKPDDKVVGFILDGEDNQKNDNWEPMPQTFFDNGNTFVYTYNFSRTGFTLFLDGNANPGTLASGKRTERYFRMLIIPGYLVGQVDLNNMHDIMAKTGIREADINVLH